MLHVTAIRYGETLEPDYPGEVPRREHLFCMRVEGSREGEMLIRSALGYKELVADGGVTMGEIGVAMRGVDGPFVPAIKITCPDHDSFVVAFGSAREVWGFVRGLDLDTYKLKDEIEYQCKNLGIKFEL